MKIKQIATISAGYPFRGKIPEVEGSAVVAVQMKDVSLTEGIHWSDCLETQLSGKRKPDYLTTGDILIAARGSHNYAVQVDQSLTSTRKQAVASPHFFVIRLKKKDILPEFMVWLLNQTPAQRYFEQNAEGTTNKEHSSQCAGECTCDCSNLSKATSDYCDSKHSARRTKALTKINQ